MWFKHDRDFLKRLWPTKPPAIRQHLVWLAMLAWEEQGIVKDFAYLSWLSGIAIESLEEVWPDFESVSICRNGRWMPAEMWQAFDAYEAKVEQARNAGKTSAEQRLNAGSTTAQRPLNARSTDKNKNKNKNKNSATNVAGAGAPTPSAQFKQFVLEAYRAALVELDAETPPYQPTAADVIQIEALRKRCDKSDWALTPERLGRALANYRASPIGVRTLADFAARFSTYFSHALNEFKQPATGGNGNGTHTITGAERNAQLLRERNYDELDALQALRETAGAVHRPGE